MLVDKPDFVLAFRTYFILYIDLRNLGFEKLITYSWGFTGFLVYKDHYYLYHDNKECVCYTISWTWVVIVGLSILCTV